MGHARPLFRARVDLCPRRWLEAEPHPYPTGGSLLGVGGANPGAVEWYRKHEAGDRNVSVVFS
eukprot:6922929-Lingulodinium_polyedra.AAC.1